MQREDKGLRKRKGKKLKPKGLAKEAKKNGGQTAGVNLNGAPPEAGTKQGNRLLCAAERKGGWQRRQEKLKQRKKGACDPIIRRKKLEESAHGTGKSQQSRKKATISRKKKGKHSKKAYARTLGGKWGKLRDPKWFPKKQRMTEVRNNKKGTEKTIN